MFDVDQGVFPPESLVTKLPDTFSWRAVPGVGNLLTTGGNQHIPHYCGAW